MVEQYIFLPELSEASLVVSSEFSESVQNVVVKSLPLRVHVSQETSANAPLTQGVQLL